MANNPENQSTPPVVEIKIRPENVALGGLILLAIISAALLIVQLRHVLVLVFVALVIAATLQRPVMLMKQWGIPRVPALIFVYLAILGVIVGIIVLVIPVLVTQIGALVENLPKMYSELIASMRSNPSALIRDLTLSMPNADQLTSQLQISGGNFLASIVGVSIGFFGIIAEAFSIIVLSMYMILDQARMERFWLSLAPASRRAQYLSIWREIETRLGTYVRGQVILMSSIAVLASLGYWAIGLPYPLALGALAGLLEFVPLIGPTLGAIPAVLVALSISPQSALLVILYSIVIQVSENNILVPRMMGHQVGVRPVTVIVAVFAFSSLLGIPGAFLAIPLAAIFQVLMDHLVLHSGVLNTEEPVADSAPVMSHTLAQIRRLRIQVLDRFRKAEHPVSLDQTNQDSVDTQVDQLLSQADQALTEAAQIASTDLVEDNPETSKEAQRALDEAHEMLDEAKTRVEEEQEKQKRT